MVQPMKSKAEVVESGDGGARSHKRVIDRAGRAAEFQRIKSPRAFEEIAEQIRKELAARRLRAGDRLPPERALAEQFGVSRNTLR